MIKFPSIEQFRNVIKNVKQHVSFDGMDLEGKPVYKRAFTLPALKYRGTVKLHGTNAGIVRTAEGLTFQSRERVLSLEEDNAGFYAHMQRHSTVVNQLLDSILMSMGYGPENEIAIFGEWCGAGIQKGVGISNVPKLFVIFAIKVNDEWRAIEYAKNVEDPEVRIFNILRFPSFEVDIDFENPHETQNKLIELTIAVEEECPVAKHFGFSGVGEGIVWQCIDPEYNSSQYWFKVKGEKHSASKVKTLAAVDVEAITAINDFVEMAVTESRLEQGLHNLVNEQLKPFEMTSMGDFIRWVYNDVLKEEHDTIIASELDAKKLGGPIANTARKWFITRLNASE
jgi:hypothetical protein